MTDTDQDWLRQKREEVHRARLCFGDRVETWDAERQARHGGRHELILTHTHAGVDALRKRLSSMGVKGTGASVQTIAGWALGYALAFPKSSGITYTLPENNAEWTAVYDAVTRLLNLSPLKNIIAASYSGGFIDEYQDCTVSQHGLILALSKIIPIRILGDPLQGTTLERQIRRIQAVTLQEAFNELYEHADYVKNMSQNGCGICQCSFCWTLKRALKQTKEFYTKYQEAKPILFTPLI